ncbi:MAG: hypothetical protein P4N60_00965, partial [Verrucomicrobiae bacterium]|nr:hypothetical protein [Verrucomicrobiae bacterium]
QDTLGCVQDVAEEAGEIKAASPVAVAEHLSVVLAARYAQLLSGWNGEMDERFSKKLKGLRLLGQEIAVMRRENLRADRLELQKTQHRDTRKDKYVAALEYCVAEGKKWPEVEQAFRKAFVLLLAHARGTGVRPQGDQGQGQTSNGQHSTSNVQAPSSSEAPKCEPHGPVGTGGTGGTGVRPPGDGGTNGQTSNIQHPTSSEVPNSNAQNGNQINRR